MTASVPQSGKFKVSGICKCVFFSQKHTSQFTETINKNSNTECQNVWGLGDTENAKRTGARFGDSPKAGFGDK